MENENVGKSTSVPLFGLLAIPVTIAIMLAMMVGATWNTVDYEASEWNTLLMITAVLLAGGLLGKAPRIIFEPIGTRPSLVSLGFAVVIGAVGMVHYYDGAALLGLAFTLMAIGVHLFDRSRRHEEEIMVVGFVAGFMYAIQVASAGHDFPDYVNSLPANYYEMVDVDRAVTGYLFFTWWIVSILVSAIIALAVRGRLQEGGRGSWFSDLPETIGKAHAPLFVGMSVWLAAHLFSLWHLKTLENPDSIYLAEHVGFFWAFFTGIIAMFAVFCWAEHWRTLSIFVAVNWMLYTFGSWQNAGLFVFGDAEGALGFLHGSLGGLSWFAIFFWLNAGVLYLGFTGRLLQGPERRTAGNARIWWNKHWYGITVASALLTALVVRVMWNVIPALNAAGTGEWDMTGGSDPWYMKRAIDYILAQNSHFIIDMDRAYPVGSINPRPPLFSWTLALGGTALNPFIDGDVFEAAWWSIAAMPAVYGALTVLPIAATCRKFFGNGAGAIGAWLMALMPGHVSHSTFALADHDAFVILFLSLGFYYWLCAAESIGSDKLLPESNWSPMNLVRGIQAAFREHPKSMSYALLAGVSFATVALGWKGFVYGLAIIYAAFFVQTALNLLRRRDSMPLTAAIIVMMLTTFLLPLPFYGNMQLDLLWDASGFQPLFYIVGFTIINGWVVTAFRDKPWLLVIIMGVGISTVLLGALYILQVLDMSNGWDVLTTGGFYFTKNKIFGTIAEAQAPSRGQLFANFGPLVFLISLGMGLFTLLRGLRQRNQSNLILSVWVLLASYMAWSAGRFMFNATPIMAIMGAAGVVGLWNWSGIKDYMKTWKRMGTSGPRARLGSTIRAGRKHPGVPAIGLVLLLLVSQHAIYGLDSGIPRGEAGEKQVDDVIYGILPDALRAEIFGWSILDSSSYPEFGVDNAEDETFRCNQDCWYMGTFGPGFNGRSWNEAYDWLENQDADVTFSERPAFVSWWDYGFQALAQGQHPTVADNFQSGIPAAGNMLLANGEEDTLALFIYTLAEGDMRYEINVNDGENGRFTQDFENVMRSHFTATTSDGSSTWDEWVEISTMDASGVEERSFKVIGSADDVVLVEGYPITDEGIRSGTKIYKLYEDRELEGEFEDFGTAIANFDSNSNVDWMEDCPREEEYIFDKNGLTPNQKNFDASSGFSCETTHYIIGDYWYTSDLYEDFGDVSTSLHRQNARYAISRNLLTNVFSMDEMVDLYSDLTSLTYEVATYEGGPGETVERNNDIRYFAVDNRLYPIGGYQYAESGMHYGNPTGIFYAPTTLSGLDPDNYLKTVYITQRGDRPEQEMTSTEFEEAYVADIMASQSGSGGDIIELNDVRVDHQSAFYETMVAKTYVGYGTTSLGLDQLNRQGHPAQHFSGYGTPDTPLTYAQPLPGAMMSHFVLANWYDPSNTDGSIGSANTGVKILKYYSGATLEGDIVLGELGAVPNAKILIERDAFSGEDETDLDGRTYWVPIATAQADDEGHYSVLVPSGRIRVSAFMGDSDLVTARDNLMTATSQDSSNWLYDLILEDGDYEEREMNPITGILTNLSGSTWLGESSINVSGDAGHSNGEITLNLDIEIGASGATGTIQWDGESQFGGEPLSNMDLRISNIWDETRQDAYHITTSAGEVEGDRQFGPSATGEVTFTGAGTMISESGVVTATDFTGNYTRSILHNHSFTGEGHIDGRGTLVGTISGASPEACVNGTMPDGAVYCLEDANQTDTILIDGSVENIDGKFTSNGTSFFTTTLYRETIIGAGTFVVDTSDTSLESYGTLNGTGTFDGIGRFSGDMVKPGSFHLIDAIPGTYHVTVLFDNGQEVILPMPLEVPLSRDSPEAKDIELLLPGTWIQGAASSLTLDGEESQAITGQLELVNFTDAEATVTQPCGDIAWAPCWFETDSEGNFGLGPVLEGEYLVIMDADDDGFDEYRSERIVVSADTAGNVTPTNIERIPPMYDIEFLLLDHEDQPVEGQNLSFSNQFSPISIDARDNGGGSYNVELPRDTWVVEGILDDNYILYKEIDLQDDIDSLVLQYVESAWVNGSVMIEADKPDDEEIPYRNQMVEVRWGGIIESTLTDDNGSFGFQLPVGAEVNLTVNVVVGHLLVGEHFTVPSGGMTFSGENTLYPRNAFGAAGNLFLYDVGLPYSQSVPGFFDHPFMIEAYDNSTGVTWHWDVEPDTGRFTTWVLGSEVENTTREWTLSVSNDALNVAPFDYNPVGDNNTLILIADPAPVDVTLSTFIDHSEDGNMSNGTAMPVDFSLVPLGWGNETVVVNITADDARWSNGTIDLELQVGNWQFTTEAKDPRSENATDYNTLLSVSNGVIEIGIGSDAQTVELGFQPEWYTSISLVNESGGPMSNWTVYFEDAEDESNQFSLDTDENGTIVEYLPEGDWIAYVNDFILDDGDDSNDDPLQTFRAAFTVDSLTSGVPIQWQAVESAQFNITLVEAGSGELLSGFTVTAVSNDGLGEFPIGPSDEDGVIDASLMPGAWTLELNRTEGQMRWILEDHSMNLVSGSSNSEMNLSLDKWVEIAGNLFRDIDANEMWSYSEGIEGANVTVSSENFGPVYLETGAIGTWRVFVPVNSTYDILATKDGYSNGSLSMDVDYVANTSDIEMFAGVVTISGLVDHILPSQWSQIADDVELVLIPESGLSYDRVIPIKQTPNGTWTGEWNAEVDPGNWLIYAEYDGSEGRFAALASIDAQVGLGGEANTTLSTASVLHISTKWFDYDQTERTLGDSDLIESGANLVFSSAQVFDWNQTVDSNGQISLLLPAGDYSFSGSFTTIERGVNMTYNGGKSAEVVGGGVESPEQMVLFSVREDHSISFTVGDSHVGVNQSTMDSDDFTILDDGDEYEYVVGEINLEMVYNGNRPEDDFLLTIEMNGGDAEFWTVEVWNGTDEDGVDVWEISRPFTMGLDSNTTQDLRLRITPANKSVAESYDSGHSMLIRMTHTDQTFNEYELKLFVPQSFGYELLSEADDMIGITPGYDETYSIEFQNKGNGDDTYTVEISDLPVEYALWSVTGPSTVTVGPGIVQAYSLNIHAPDLPSIGDNDEFDIYVTFTSENNVSYEAIKLKIKATTPQIEFGDAGTLGQSQSGFAVMNTVTQLYVDVENTGDVDARAVTVEVLDDSESPQVVATATLDVPMNETVQFVFDIPAVDQQGSIDYTFRVNGTDDLTDLPDEKMLKVNYQPQVSKEANDYLGLVVLLFVIAILFLFWKFGGRMSSQAF